MKHLAVAAALLLGMGSAGYGQTGVPAAQLNTQSVHPGTAILDSMGIVAGAPDKTEKAEASSAAANTARMPADVAQKRP
jgi:hypothetical protein